MCPYALSWELLFEILVTYFPKISSHKFVLSFLILEKLMKGVYSLGYIYVNVFPGAQFKVHVEYAPSQHVPKTWSKKDVHEGTIIKGLCPYLNLNFQW